MLRVIALNDNEQYITCSNCHSLFIYTTDEVQIRTRMIKNFMRVEDGMQTYYNVTCPICGQCVNVSAPKKEDTNGESRINKSL